MTIVEFLTARLDEDEAAAKAASHHVLREKWHAVEWYDGEFIASGRRTAHVDIHGLAGTPITSRGALRREDGEHIARHDPARVLREVKAKRVIVEQWKQAAERNRRDECDEAAGATWATLGSVLVSLAGVYDSHPDYAGDSVDDWAWPDDDPAWTIAT